MARSVKCNRHLKQCPAFKRMRKQWAIDLYATGLGATDVMRAVGYANCASVKYLSGDGWRGRAPQRKALSAPGVARVQEFCAGLPDPMPAGAIKTISEELGVSPKIIWKIRRGVYGYVP